MMHIEGFYELEQCKNSRTRLEEESMDKLTFYSDGSVKDMGKDTVSMAFGVVQRKANNQFRDIVGGRTDGHASSTKAELVGLLAASTLSPRDRDVRVFSDNAAVVQNFRTLVRKRADGTQRQKVRTTYASWWAWVEDEYRKEGSRDHSGSIGDSSDPTLRTVTNAAARVIGGSV